MRRRLLSAIALAVLLLGCTPPLVLQPPVRFYALNLPTTALPADSDGQPVAGVFRSVRLLLDDRPLARSQTLVGDTEQGELLMPGHTLGMAFAAPRSFSGVAVSLGRVGPGPTGARLTLRRGGRHGAIIAARDLTNLPQRGWAEVRTASEPAGQYYLELSNATGDGIYWRGAAIEPTRDLWQGYREGFVPFALPQTLAELPHYDGGSMGILVNTEVERIYILGGRSSYDYGVGHWGDYEARGDTSDRQFIGDRIGDMEVIYTDGSRDRVPLILGFNQWWWKRWGDVPSGGPFLEPFLTTPRPMIASLHVYSLDNSPLAPSFWVYRPQPKPIARLRFVDNPQIQGFPLVAAITLEARRSGPNAKPLPTPDPDSRFAAWLEEHTITPHMVAGGAYEQALVALRQALYTSAGTMPTAVSPDPVPDHRGPRLRFEGTVGASILTNVYEHSLRDLRAKLDPDGTFHTSTAGSPNFGLYGGIGTWRNGVGYFYHQAWARDMGRTLLELTRLGFLDEVDAGLRFAAAHLYELANSFPDVQRRGEPVPPHWGTVLGMPNIIDVDGMRDDNQENDGHGLLLLAYVRAWQARGRSSTWLNGFWPVIRDAAEWFCFQLENPAFSRATRVLYTEGEAAQDGGYDVYSNVIAVEALRGAADMARSRNDDTLTQRWLACAQTISGGLVQELTDRDTRYGQTWRAVAWGWGYGHESLAPAFVPADRTGYLLTAGPTLTITQQTYRRQVELPSGFRSGRVLGYGQAFLTQAALLLDDMAGAGEALETLARFIYHADTNPYLVPEGIALHPSGEYWYRTGDLGNAMQEAEVLKTLALVAGVDDLSGQQVTLVPRLPLSWTGMTVSSYPVTVGDQRLSLSYTLQREGREMRMSISANGLLPRLAVRLGPLPMDASPRVTLDGEVYPAETAESGGYRWVWLRNLGGQQRLQIRLVW